MQWSGKGRALSKIMKELEQTQKFLRNANGTLNCLSSQRDRTRWSLTAISEANVQIKTAADLVRGARHIVATHERADELIEEARQARSKANRAKGTPQQRSAEQAASRAEEAARRGKAAADRLTNGMSSVKLALARAKSAVDAAKNHAARISLHDATQMEWKTLYAARTQLVKASEAISSSPGRLG